MSDLPDAAAVLRAVERRFRIYGPSVDAAMSVFVPVLEERDEEIERLRGLVAAWACAGKSRCRDLSCKPLRCTKRLYKDPGSQGRTGAPSGVSLSVTIHPRSPR